MIKLIVVCHGKLAVGLVDAMQVIMGPQENLTAISLEEEDSIDGLEARVETAVQDRQPGEGVLIMTDLFGASPFNVSARVAARNDAVDVITGANLAMLLETALQRENTTVAELVKIAKEASSSSVKVLSEIMNEA